MEGAQSLPHRDRVRRVVLLCCSIAQNVTFYRAAVADPTASILSDHHPEAAFLRRTINNFLDIAVLDWASCSAAREAKSIIGGASCLM
jgi:hypothetical protein